MNLSLATPVVFYFSIKKSLLMGKSPLVDSLQESTKCMKSQCCKEGANLRKSLHFSLAASLCRCSSFLLVHCYRNCCINIVKSFWWTALSTLSLLISSHHVSISHWENIFLISLRTLQRIHVIGEQRKKEKSQSYEMKLIWINCFPWSIEMPSY